MRAATMKAAAFMLAVLAAGCASGATAMNGNPEMPYPPKGGPKVEEIYHLPTGLRLSPDGMMAMLSGARLVSIGETHDNLNDQRVELTVIRELFRRFPGQIAIGMEMFRAPQQDVLDRWTRGELTELEFLKQSRWYKTWGYDFGAYREILRFARENRIDVVALDPPRELQDDVSRLGLDNLPETDRRQLPRIDESDPWQRAALRGVFVGHAGHAGGESAFEAFYRVQLLWEETMAGRVVDYLRSPRGRGKKMVTITGGWHVKYGFGVPKKVIRRMPMTYAIVLPEEISTPEQKEGRSMVTEVPEIPLLPGDFMWYVPYDSIKDHRVFLGIGMEEKGGRLQVETVMPDSPAKAAGMQKGDRLVSFDGHPLTDMVDVRYLVGEKKAGDTAEIGVLRDGAPATLHVTFFRMALPGHH
jgi:uncharacterized iron-regulated protein